jgi:hypothetical protein
MYGNVDSGITNLTEFGEMAFLVLVGSEGIIY